MRSRIIIMTILFIALAAGCTTQFLPDAGENPELLVVEGLITDQDSVYRIRLSRSTPIGTALARTAVEGALVTITDEKGIVTTLKESPPGTYSTDSTIFRGRIGGSYSLHFKIDNANYETDFIEMKPVPPIDSIYYEKVVITPSKDSIYIEEGCKIYVDAYDPGNKCLFYRWDYVETWEYRIPYSVANQVCWITEQSGEILVKNTSVYSQARVTKYPLVFVTDETDRLKVKYSILVNQYSLDEAEYNFWEKVRTVSQNVGNLYDITPSTISGNIRCTTNPDEIVLGYFSVSAVTQKRLFVVDTFLGLPTFYSYCATDTIFGDLPDGLNTSYWIIEDYANEIPPTYVITTFRECADCTTEGTKVKPPFWDDQYPSVK